MVILVDKEDRFWGVMDKMAAHRKGRLHRAFSVFLFNSRGELLLQKRAAGKYHSGGAWTNSCCSHPWPGEKLGDAVHRRLREELGLDAPVSPVFTFHYEAILENNLIENELDHVFVGITNDIPDPNPEEIEDYQFISIPELKKKLLSHSWEFTVWFRIIFERYSDKIENAIEKNCP